MNKAQVLKRLIAAARDISEHRFGSSPTSGELAALRQSVQDLDAADQSAPVANDYPPLWPLVIKHMGERYVGSVVSLVVADMYARHEYGTEFYGVPLQPHNGRDALRDLYEEILDARVYAEQVAVERRGEDDKSHSRFCSDLEQMILHVRGIAGGKALLAPTNSPSTDLLANVSTFHVAVGINDPKRPCVPLDDVVRLRARMLVEELFETLRSMFQHEFGPAEEQALAAIDLAPVVVSLPDYADSLADLMYIAEGGFIAFGIDSRPVHAEVQRANMAKVGGPVREDGKRLKPPGWTPPDIAGVIERQKDAA